MFKFSRQVFSRDLSRFQADGFDLDLSYITPNIIAMGFPSKGMEKTYRNNIEEVSKFFKKRHNEHFLILNLTERKYDYEKFDNQVLEFPWKDHYPPPLKLLFQICQIIDKWIKSDQENVVAVHCLAGRGRTGTVISSYLRFSGMFNSTEQAIQYFAKKRSQKLIGVTNPSQLRYVIYFDKILRENNENKFRIKTISLQKIIFNHAINVHDGGFHPEICIYNDSNLVYSSKTRKPQSPSISSNSLAEKTHDSMEKFPFFSAKSDDFIIFPIPNLKITGEILIMIFNHKTCKADKNPKLLCRVNLFTSFLDSPGVTLTRKDLDGAHKKNSKLDKRFGQNFRMDLIFEDFQDSENIKSNDQEDHIFLRLSQRDSTLNFESENNRNRNRNQKSIQNNQNQNNQNNQNQNNQNQNNQNQNNQNQNNQNQNQNNQNQIKKQHHHHHHRHHKKKKKNKNKNISVLNQILNQIDSLTQNLNQNYSKSYNQKEKENENENENENHYFRNDYFQNDFLDQNQNINQNQNQNQIENKNQNENQNENENESESESGSGSEDSNSNSNLNSNSNEISNENENQNQIENQNQNQNENQIQKSKSK
ncbi:phosphatase [Anaeramoeba ignava]|uniref:Phosphatase n=1 Tax=Anaeramoeba ignava TaxID=1746090 RepID=A0A9Q0L8S3_ANAIG|nr:phosphatase [Anaeramoeba ignava]